MKVIIGTNRDVANKPYEPFDMPVYIVDGYKLIKKGHNLYYISRSEDDDYTTKVCECCGTRRYYPRPIKYRILGRSNTSFAYRVMRKTRKLAASASAPEQEEGK